MSSRNASPFLRTQTFLGNFWGGTACLAVIGLTTLVLVVVTLVHELDTGNAVKRDTWGKNGASSNCAGHAGECKIALYNKHRDSCIAVNEADGSDCTSSCWNDTTTCSNGECVGVQPAGTCNVDGDCPDITLVIGTDQKACVDGICLYVSGNATAANADTMCDDTFMHAICEANVDGETLKGCLGVDSFCEVDTDPAKKRSIRRGKQPKEKLTFKQYVYNELHSQLRKRGAVVASLDNSCFYYFTAAVADAPFADHPTL